LEVLESRTVPAVQLGPNDLTVFPLATNEAAQLGDTLYFVAGDGNVWRTDGTPAHTSKLASDPAYSGLAGIAAGEIAVAGGTVYFSGTPRVTSSPTSGGPIPPGGLSPPPGISLWKLDPAAPGGVTALAGSSGAIRDLTTVGEHLFFAADASQWGSGANLGYETDVWVTDGTLNGTHELLSSNSLGEPGFQQPTAAGGRLYFGQGSSLWESDGTTVGTRALTGPDTAYPDVVPSDLVAAGNKVFFTSLGSDDTTRGLWLADADQLTLLNRFLPTDSLPLNGLVTDGTRAYVVISAMGGSTVWASDGTSAGTAQLFATTSQNWTLGQLTPAGTSVFFTATDADHGTELWKFYGTSIGLVSDINPGTASSDVQSLGFVNGTYYFSANDGTNGYQLWSSDGTAAGTVRLTNLSPGTQDAAPDRLYSVNGRLLFAADEKLWAFAKPAPLRTQTTLTLSTTPAALGQRITLTARVVETAGSGTPTGSVEFRDGNKLLGTVRLDRSGTASLMTATLGLGHHAITAVYSGNDEFPASTSAATDQLVLPPTMTKLVAGPATAVFGQSVTLTATVAPAAGGAVKPGGTVTFFDGQAILGTATLANGVATLKLPQLSLGTHALTASYAGNLAFAGSGASPISLIIWQAPTAVSLRASTQTIISGQAVSLTATVSVPPPGAGKPSGAVTFFDGPTPIGSAPISGGAAVLAGVKLPPGVRRLLAVYSGDADFHGTNSAPIAVTVQTATLTVVGVPPSVFGQTVPLKATVTGLAPGSGKAVGGVTFKDGTLVLGTANVYNGVAYLSVTGLAVGTHLITAVYDGANEFVGSASVAFAYNVGRAPPGLSLTPVSSPTTQVSLRAAVQPAGPGLAGPTGTVTFKEGTRVLGAASVSATGLAEILATLTRGQHTIGVYYGGDSNYLTWYAPLTVTIA
jgi:ELWxxDGT repeat protein